MKIAIVGTGRIGGTLARRFLEHGHDISVANSRGGDSLSELADLGARAAAIDDVATGAEVVILAVPKKALDQLPPGFLEQADDRVIVIDPSNYAPKQRDGRIPELEEGVAESRWTERQIGHPVVKAFNNITADDLERLGSPPHDGRIALPVAGDVVGDKETVTGLVDEAGFDAVDAGGLDESWRQQPGTPVYATNLDAAGVRVALAQTSPERPEEWRA